MKTTTENWKRPKKMKMTSKKNKKWKRPQKKLKLKKNKKWKKLKWGRRWRRREKK